MTKDAQLTLIDSPRSWRMDEHTREVGRAGIARAREALRAGLHARTQDPPAGPGGGTPGAQAPVAAAAVEPVRRPAARRSGPTGGGPRRAAA